MTDLPSECEEVLNQLDAFRRGELNHDEIAEMKVHLDACAKCLSVERFERAFLARLRAMGSPPCPDALREKIGTALAHSAHDE